MFAKSYIGLFILFVCLWMFAGCDMSADKGEESGLEGDLISNYDMIQIGADYLINGYEYEREKTEKMEDTCHEFYGTWRIEKVALRSKMYTGTTRDGYAEEDVYDSEDFIGFEVQYAENFLRLDDQFFENPYYFFAWTGYEGYNAGGIYYPYSILDFINDENIVVEDENKMRYFWVEFEEPVGYGKRSFIPLVTYGLVLNHDTLLLGAWGEIMVAYRVEEVFCSNEVAATEYSQTDADEIFYGTWIYNSVVSDHYWLGGTKGYESMLGKRVTYKSDKFVCDVGEIYDPTYLVSTFSLDGEGGEFYPGQTDISELLQDALFFLQVQIVNKPPLNGKENYYGVDFIIKDENTLYAYDYNCIYELKREGNEAENTEGAGEYQRRF